MTPATPPTPASSSAWPPGYRIEPRQDRLPAALIDAFRSIPVAVSNGRSIDPSSLAE